MGWMTGIAETSSAYRDYDKKIAKFRRRYGGRAFVKARESMGLTQGEMAHRLGVHPTYLSRVEVGRLIAGPKLIVKLEEVLRGKHR